MKLNQAQAASLLGVDVKTIRNYQKLNPGLPFIKVNATVTEYEDSEIVQWFCEYKLQQFKNTLQLKPEDKRIAEAREMLAKAELREIELAEAKGELVKVKDVEQTWTNLILTIRQSLLNVPHQIATLIDDGMKYQEKIDKVQGIIDTLLKYLAETEKG